MVKGSHWNDSLLGQEPCQDVNDLLDQALSDLNRLLAQVSQWLHLVNIQVSVASSIELIVDFEQPGVNVEVIRDQLGQRQHELLFVIDIN